MNRCSWHLLFATSLMLAATVRAETESIDLKALAKKARPAVLLLVVSDATGKEIATGTGFLVSSDGKLITNHHVIENAASAVAKAENGALFPVEGVLADDPKNDLVLLKLKGKAESDETQPIHPAANLPFLPLGNSDKVEVGTRIAVIGSPLGLEGTLSEGIVSAVREFMGDQRLLQVTAAISPGSSGSPVLSAKGNVVGVASALLRGGQSLNFAVPAEIARKLLQADANVTAKSLTSFRDTPSDSDSEVYQSSEYRETNAAFVSADWVAMLKASQALVQKFPESWVGYSNLGLAYEQMHFFDDAVAAHRQAIKLKPNFAGEWYNLGAVYLQQRNYDDAIAACRQAIKLAPDFYLPWHNLGGAYLLQHKYDDAIAASRQAIDLKPDDAKAWFLLGDAYDKSGRTDDAIAAFRQAIKLKPDDADVWYFLGIAFRRAGRSKDATDAFQQAKKLKPEWFK
ncbi:MAG: tetratricopeptide repeat protein [Verrucomicrobiia bacterium]